MTDMYDIKFSTVIANVLPKGVHLLSTDGPFIDAHFGKIDSSNPVGQTYFVRPLSQYDSVKKVLRIEIGCSNYTTHFNKNDITDKVGFCGTVVITDVTIKRSGSKLTYIPGKDSRIRVDIAVHNDTGLPLRGLHIHDGKLKDGLTGFGPISYFLFNTKYWNKHKTDLPAPLPRNNVIPKTDFVLNNSLKSMS